MKRKAHIILLVLLLLCVLSTTAFAIDESEVESAIAASSKEEVAGNVFIWFLCAIGFLKVSQKIDSFMASLGINVGRTGGSMLTELMVAGRGIAAVAGAVGGTVFNHHSSSNSTHTNAQAAGAAFTGGGNGLVGVTRRAAGNAAAASATGNAKGLSNLVGGAMFESSLQNGGKFAMSVVGAVAKGSISSVGSITGDQAAEALTSYLGYSPVDSGSALADDGGLIPPSPITSEDVVTLDGGTAAGTASPTASANGTPIPSGAREHDGSVVESARISGAPPIFQNVEIGGGRITGLEVSPDRQSDREFAMYSTEQYMAPTGPYDTVQTVDGASWYRQYAQPKVEKTPYSVTKKPLEGVQFRITYSDGSFVADEGGKLSSNGLYMTDANGEILIRDIVGTLVVTEVKTIPGYTIDEATRSQTIVVNPDDLQTLIVYNVPAGGLQIIKSDADTGERLGGVKFEIRKINGEILGTYTTDRDGVISIPNAESGWYTIVERKAKDGYALDTTPVNACVKDSETTTVEITNQRMASIMIHKIDAATGTGIYGVKFVLYDSGKNPIGEYTTDQDGYIYIDDELVPGKYYLRELEAADGYIRDEQYKTVYVERGKCAQIEWENSAVTGQIQIRKYSSEDNTVTGQLAGTPLEGAVFEITQARSGKVVGYIVTDARGVAASGPLPLGRYFVTEVSAPKYYQLSGEKMEAEIEYPSQIIKLSAYNKPASLGVTIKKSGNYEVQSGQSMSYDFSGIANTSNVALNHFFWHDRIPTDATRALSISTGTYNARLYYKVTFKTNLNDYRTLASNLLTSNNYSLSLNAATLRLAQGEYVTDVRFEFGTVPSGFSSVVKPTMRVQVLGTVSNGYQIINRADVGGQYLNEWQTAKTTWVTTVRRFNTTPLPKTGY